VADGVERGAVVARSEHSPLQWAGGRGSNTTSTARISPGGAVRGGWSGDRYESGGYPSGGGRRAVVVAALRVCHDGTREMIETSGTKANNVHGMEQSKFSTSWIPVTISYNILIKDGEDSLPYRQRSCRSPIPTLYPSKYADQLLPPYADLQPQPLVPAPTCFSPAGSRRWSSAARWTSLETCEARQGGCQRGMEASRD